MNGIDEITFISQGFKQVLESDGVRDLIQQHADEICERANANFGGDGFAVNVRHFGYGGGRWGAFISSVNRRAAAAESEEHVLTRAIN